MLYFEYLREVFTRFMRDMGQFFTVLSSTWTDAKQSCTILIL